LGRSETKRSRRLGGDGSSAIAGLGLRAEFDLWDVAAVTSAALDSSVEHRGEVAIGDNSASGELWAFKWQSRNRSAHSPRVRSAAALVDTLHILKGAARHVSASLVNIFKPLLVGFNQFGWASL
jgi:hypothetical protein